MEVGQGSDPSRRARLLREGPGAGRALSPDRQGAGRTRAASREREPARPAPRALRPAGSGRAVIGHADRSRPRRARGADRRHRADPGGIRNGQGSDREGRASRERARGAALRGRELRRGARDVARIRALRLCAGRLHGRRRQQARPVRGSRRRHPLPGRDRRDAGRPPGEAPPGAPERRGETARRHAGGDLRRAGDRSHERRSRDTHQRRELPRGSLLSPQRHPRGAAAAARAPRGHPGAGRAFPRPIRGEARPDAAPVTGRPRTTPPLSLARERTRAGERD